MKISDESFEALKSEGGAFKEVSEDSIWFKKAQLLEVCILFVKELSSLSGLNHRAIYIKIFLLKGIWYSLKNYTIIIHFSTTPSLPHDILSPLGSHGLQ